MPDGPSRVGPKFYSGSTGPNSSSSSEAAHISIPGLSSAQTQCLLSLIDGPADGYERLSGNVNWMLDSGASSHMAGDVALLNKVEKIPLVAIGLPNGTFTMAREQGSVALEQEVELKNVLYVPQLNCNLISCLLYTSPSPRD